MEIFKIHERSNQEVSEWLETAEKDEIIYAAEWATEWLDSLYDREFEDQELIDGVIFRLQMLHDVLGDFEIPKDIDEGESQYD